MNRRRFPTRRQRKNELRNPTPWRPGMYEGKTVAQVHAAVGTAVPPAPTQPCDDMNWRKLSSLDRHVAARY